MPFQQFIRSIFKSNSAKLADFRKVAEEFGQINRNLEMIQAEKNRLSAICEKARSAMLEKFALENVKIFSAAAVASDDFAAAANSASSLFVHTIESREKTQRVREVCLLALDAAAGLVQAKINELSEKDSAHFMSQGLNPSDCGTSEAVKHLQHTHETILATKGLAEQDGSSFWTPCRELLAQFDASGI